MSGNASLIPRVPFEEAARAAIDDTQLRRNLGKATSTIRAKRMAVVHELSDWEALRSAGAAIKDRMLGRMDEGQQRRLLRRTGEVIGVEPRQMRRKLVLCHREMPLSPIDVNNYKALSDAGVILASANPGFYLNPTTLGEVVDFVAGKLLDLIGVAHSFDTRWDPHRSRAAERKNIV